MRFFPDRNLPTEADLRHSFPEAVGALSLDQLVLMDQAKVPSRLGFYGLVPILGREGTVTPDQALLMQPGLSKKLDYFRDMGVMWDIPVDGADEIKVGYLEKVLGDLIPPEKPSLGGSLALGLTFRTDPRKDSPETRLVAAAGLHVPKPGLARIVHLQAAWTVPEARKKDTGLWGGFNWRRALVRGLVEVVEEAGFREIEVMGARGHMRRGEWGPAGPSFKDWKRNYDEVAEAVGFRRRWPWSRNLSLNLPRHSGGQ